ncbi:MAG TPA: hypothetical protein VNB64_09030 [Solirubrobacteraceae bacterium]|nr:hypothetical protein [Solirubrobacteraceae bacterium]
MAPERYFILIYDVPSRALEIHEFEQDYAGAADAYTGFEREHRNAGGMEVLLVGADSIETIKTTHSHYFAERADDLFRQFLEAETVPSGGRVLAATQKTRRRKRRGH